MKRILALSCTLVLFSAAFSQTYRNQFLMGGNMNYSSKTQEVPGGDDQTVNTISLSPGIGYFFARNLALGGRLSASSTKVTNGKNERYVVSPFLRYYLLKPSSTFNFMIDGSYSTGKYKSGAVERKIQGYGVSGGPVIFVKQSVGLEFTFSYLADKMEGGNWFKTMQAGVGFQVHLGRGKIKLKKKKKAEEEDDDDFWGMF